MSVELKVKRNALRRFWDRHDITITAFLVTAALFIIVTAVVFIPANLATHAECNRLHEMNGWATQVRAMTCYVNLDGYWIPSGQVGYYLGGGR